jgi:hypothetical protein
MSKTEITNLFKSQQYSRSNSFSGHMEEDYEKDIKFNFGNL